MSEDFYGLHGSLKTYGNEFKESKKELINEANSVIKENMGDFDNINLKIQEKYQQTNDLLKNTFLIFMDKLSSIEEVKQLIIIEKTRNENCSSGPEAMKRNFSLIFDEYNTDNKTSKIDMISPNNQQNFERVSIKKGLHEENKLSPNIENDKIKQMNNQCNSELLPEPNLSSNTMKKLQFEENKENYTAIFYLKCFQLNYFLCMKLINFNKKQTETLFEYLFY